MLLQAHTMHTPIGPLALLARDGVVLAGGFTDDLAALVSGRLRATLRDARIEETGSLGPISEALDAYFAGEVGALARIPVAYTGAPFQQRVWEALRAIPPGQPTTYKALALQFGNARLARAVGMGCATNLISPIIPCHRVTHGTGHLAGYAWSLDRKRWLLDHERRHAAR
ncbi:MAG: methylated-DNA--[protein]-cysteine S-methyltransferase [Chloroflexi bacterium]|nr:methylated-DNA--[protein]-cysteine S-methyltransferase [Chloroflexota bacterium]